MYLDDGVQTVEVLSETNKVKLLLKPGTIVSPMDPIVMRVMRTAMSITVSLEIGNHGLPMDTDVDAWLVDANAMAALSIQAPAADVGYEQVAPGATASGAQVSVPHAKTSSSRAVAPPKKPSQPSTSSSSVSRIPSPAKIQKMSASSSSQLKIVPRNNDPKSKMKEKRSAGRRKNAKPNS